MRLQWLQAEHFVLMVGKTLLLLDDWYFRVSIQLILLIKYYYSVLVI